jgi:hypothetical protein
MARSRFILAISVYSENKSVRMSRWSRLMASTDEQRGVVRYAAWAFLLHAVLVVVTVVMKQSYWGTNVPWWRLERLLILIDMPMDWAIRPSLQSLPFLPGWLVFNSVRVAAGVNEIVLRALLGGAFYAVLVAAIVFVRERKRNEAAVKRLT